MRPQTAYQTDAPAELPEGYTLHPFDEASRDLALKLGYEIGCEYEVFLG